MLCYCLRVVVCVGIVITYVSPVPLSPASSPCPWSFHPRRIHPACPCGGCRRRSALRASRQTTTRMTTPRASLVFRLCTMASSSCSSSLLVSVIIVIGVVLPKCPSQSQCSPTSKKLHMYSPTSMSAPSSSSSSVTMLLLLMPSQSSSPMNRDEIDRGHRHRRDCRTPHRCRRGTRCHSDDRAEKDPVCQAEEGVVQAASGVGTITSVVLLLLCRLR